VRVEQCRPQRVFELPLAEAQAVAQPADHVRRLAHALHAAAEDDVRFAELDHLAAARRRLDAGAAQAIHRQRRHLDRHARLQADVARAVDGVGTGLQHVAEHDVIDVLRLDPGPLHRRPRRDRSELQRRKVLQLACVLRHGGARTTQNEDLFHRLPLFTAYGSPSGTKATKATKSTRKLFGIRDLRELCNLCAERRRGVSQRTAAAM
jgi:hypothetical protein